MDLSGVIFVVLAVAWAVYLIPMALKHHDEVARTRSIDRFSTAMRVLARREPVNRRDTRLVVTPARRDTPRMLVPARAAAAVATSEKPPGVEEVRRPPARPEPPRASARAAARRRRRILGLLFLVVVALVVVAGFGYSPWWSVSIPGGLCLAYLFLCRYQVRRDNRVTRSAALSAEALADNRTTAPRRAVRVEAPYAAAQPARDQHRSEGASVDEDTVSMSSAAIAAALAAPSPEEADAAAAAIAVPRDGSLWDPLPMTLPTYVGKPRAARTVRTIDLSQPDTWSSGRSEADSELVGEAVAAREEASKTAGDKRAVGS